ncbi:MAG: transcription-repair coupling factor (superfamily II helicase), partial [Flavobacteriales bacterium]
MDFIGLRQGYIADSSLKDAARKLAEVEYKIHLKNLVGSAVGFSVMSVFKNSNLPQLIVLNDKEEAAYFLNDLEEMIGEKEVLFYPGSYRRPYQIEETDNANVRLRAEVLNKINTSKKPKVIVTYPDALFERVITKKELTKNTLHVREGDNLSIDFLNETLFEYHFERIDFVVEPGQFSVRGGIVDVFSFSNEHPYRIEFFGDDVESIRTFDIANQLSIKMMKRLAIVPNVERKVVQESREFFLNYLPSNTVVWMKSVPFTADKLDDHFTKAEESFNKLSEAVQHSTPEA